MGQRKRSKKRPNTSDNKIGTSTSSSEDEVKKTRATTTTKKRLSRKSTISNTSEYDGDCEESTETSTQSDTSMKSSMDLYDFDEPDSESPTISSKSKKKQTVEKTQTKQSRKEDSKVTTKKHKPKGKNNDSDSNDSNDQQLDKCKFPLDGENFIEYEVIHAGDKNERKGKSKQRSLVTVEDKTFSPSQDVEMKNVSKKSMIKLNRVDMSQYKLDSSKTNGQKRKSSEDRDSSKRKSARISGQQSVQDESGFLSPPLPRRVGKILATKETSTPNVRRKSTESCFGFETLTTAEPMLSPVRFTSPTSDYGSMMSSSAQSSTASRFDTSTWRDKSKRTYNRRSGSLVKNNVEPILYDLSTVEEKKKKVSRPKKRKEVLAKYEDWADKMNAEFEEIEMHELSIEG